jgi:hypothetical protein
MRGPDGGDGEYLRGAEPKKEAPEGEGELAEAGSGRGAGLSILVRTGLPPIGMGAAPV